MTKSPTPRHTTARALLSRLLLLLALMLFGVPQSHADGTLAHADPTAHSKVEQSQGILIGQRHLLRAQLLVDASPDTMAPGVAVQALQRSYGAAMSPARHLSLLSVAIRILPPVRGPPAA